MVVPEIAATLVNSPFTITVSLLNGHSWLDLISIKSPTLIPVELVTVKELALTRWAPVMVVEAVWLLLSVKQVNAALGRSFRFLILRTPAVDRTSCAVVT